MNDSDIQSMLSRPPEMPLPADLWARVETAYAKRMAFAQRLRVGASAAAVAAVAVIATWHWPHGHAPSSVATGLHDLASGSQDRPVIADADAGNRLRALDRRLQSAYSRDAPQAEIDLIWQQRRAMSAPENHASIEPLRI